MRKGILVTLLADPRAEAEVSRVDTARQNRVSRPTQNESRSRILLYEKGMAENMVWITAIIVPPLSTTTRLNSPKLARQPPMGCKNARVSKWKRRPWYQRPQEKFTHTRIFLFKKKINWSYWFDSTPKIQFNSHKRNFHQKFSNRNAPMRPLS